MDKIFVVTLEVPGEKARAASAHRSMDGAKRAVFEQEHMYDDTDVLVADQRDVTWLEDGEDQVADALDNSCTYTITPVEVLA